MTVVISQKQRIHYRFEGEKGAYLLLHHGLLGSHRDWYDAGYVDALRDEFRLIVMDARGHGRSDRPLDPAQYRLETLVDDVIAVMDELDIRNLHFFGYSLGALVGFELLMRHPERVRIVMLGGEAPFLAPTVQAQWRELAEAIGRDGLPAVRLRMEREGWRVAVPPSSPLLPAPPEQEGEALAAQALLQALAEQVPRADEGRISVDSPVALFTGEADPALSRIRDARRRIHRARFVSVPGQSHAGLFLEREALLREIVYLLRPGRKDGSTPTPAGEGEGGGEGDGEGDGEGGSRNAAGAAGADRGGQDRNERASERERGNGGQRGERFGRGRGRGRGDAGSEGGARRVAPLSPPPPVEVPTDSHAPAASTAAGHGPDAPSTAEAQARAAAERLPEQPSNRQGGAQAPDASSEPVGQPAAPEAAPRSAQSADVDAARAVEEAGRQGETEPKAARQPGQSDPDGDPPDRT